MVVDVVGNRDPVEVNRPTRRVDPAELRRVFNEGSYYERLLNNELIASVETEHPASPHMGQPPGTMSQGVWYFDLSFRRVAYVHQFLLPDGTIGASGRPDPKRLLLDDEILFC